MAQCHAEGKKHPTGALDLYAGVFNSKVYSSNGGYGNVDRYQSLSRYNVASSCGISGNSERYPKEIASDRMTLYCGSLRERQIKNGTFTKGDADGASLKSGSTINGGNDHAGSKDANQNGGLVVGVGKVGSSFNGGEPRNGAISVLAVGSSAISNAGIQKKDHADAGCRAARYSDSGELSKSTMKPAFDNSLMIGAPVVNMAAQANSSSPNATMWSKGSPNGNGSVAAGLKAGCNMQTETASICGSSAAEALRGGKPSPAGNVTSNGRSPTSGTARGTGSIVGADASAPDSVITGNLGNLKPPSAKSVSNDGQASTLTAHRGTSPKNSGEISSNNGGMLKSLSTPKVSSEGNLNGGIITGSNSGSVCKTAKSSTVSPNKTSVGGANITNVGNICRSSWNGSVLNGGNVSTGVATKGNGKIDVANGSGHIVGNGSTGSTGSNGNVLNLGNGLASKGNVKVNANRNGAESIGTGNLHLAGESILMKRALSWTDPEEVKNAGNDQYKKGHFSEALSLYDKAIALSPSHAAYRSNRAAALAGLGRLAEAVQECEEAIRLDPNYGRAHQRAASLYLRLGLVETSKRHLQAAGQQSDWGDIQRLQNAEKHISKCIQSRKGADWKSVIRESDAAVVAGADSAPQIFGYKAEALLKLHKPEEADAVLLAAERVESTLTKPGVTPADSLLFVIRAQIDLALGRYEGAVTAAESAARIDPRNAEVSSLLRKARAVGHARMLGNDLFKAGKFFEACASYGEGLESDPMNAVLLCNRAACRSKLGQWEKAVEDCNAALNIQPNYTKALMRRANCSAMLERWEDALRDYEVLRSEVPGDMEVARGLFDVQVAIKKSRGEEIYKMKFGGEVEEVSSSDHFREAVTAPGLAVVQFNTRWSDRCRQISPFIDQLCKRYPSVNFIKVDVDDNPYLAKIESVSFVPTFKIYKNGLKVKEILGPSQQALEYAVKHYSL